MKTFIKKAYLMGITFLCFLPMTTPAVSAERSYPAKDNIIWIVASAPGGGFDTYARVLAPYLGKYLPHPVNVIVRNVPGSGGLSGASMLYNAKPDGYTIGYVYFPGIALLSRTSNIGFDYHKFTSVAQIATDTQAIFVSAKSDIKTLADLQKKNPLRILTQPKGVSMYSFWQIAIDVMKLKPKLITGYKGGNEVATGLMRDDGDAGILNVGQFIKYQKSGDLRAIVTFSKERHPLTPDVPSAGELGYGESSVITGWKIIYGPPGLPADITKALETAFEKSLNDPKVQAWAKKTGHVFQFVDGKTSWEDMQKAIKVYSKYD
jgi:tripartite-type tricarboxylate transporter receptor subunit TctC